MIPPTKLDGAMAMQGRRIIGWSKVWTLGEAAKCGGSRKGFEEQ
jgi:hypothetical protein